MESGVVTAVGVWFYSTATDRLLYLMRNGSKHAMTWGLPGGKTDRGESLLTTIERECQEEMGLMPQYHRLYPVEQFTSSDQNFVYHTFFCPIVQEFQPRLNHEHQGYAWIRRGVWPRPMHPGLWNMVNLEEVMTKISYLARPRSDVAKTDEFSHRHPITVG